jgi:hypothetical protein
MFTASNYVTPPINQNRKCPADSPSNTPAGTVRLQPLLRSLQKGISRWKFTEKLLDKGLCLT